MCMTFYIGSSQPLPILQWDGNNPGFHTIPLSEEEKSIYKQISFPNILYVGSHHGCGCGFRHAILDGEQWSRLVFEEEELEELEKIQGNHLQLYNYIQSNAGDGEPFEIYGCWDGDLNEAALSVEEINVADLLAKDFDFRERGLYTIKTAG